MFKAKKESKSRMMLIVSYLSDLGLELPPEDDVYYLIDMRDMTMLRHTLEPIMLKFLSKVLLQLA